MPVLPSSINPRSPEFARNAQAMRALVEDLRAQLARVALGGSEQAALVAVVDGIMEETLMPPALASRAASAKA